MKKFEVHQVILQDDGKIQLTCECCRRPSAFDLTQSANFLKTANKNEWWWACQFEDCERSEANPNFKFIFNSLDKEQVQKILRWNKNDN